MKIPLPGLISCRWAWQNPHLTLHIPAESRLTTATKKKRSGRPKRPPHSMQSLLSNLHLLLHVDSFSRWPLELRFFSKDVFAAWNRYLTNSGKVVRSDLKIVCDFPVDDKLDPSTTEAEEQHVRGLEALEFSFSSMKDVMVKSASIFDFEQEGNCSICDEKLKHDGGIYTICPAPGCHVVSHMICLSKHFLSQEGGDSVLPVKGQCKSCSSEVFWSDIVREVTLRMRGEKELAQIMKIKRVKTQAAKAPKEAKVSSITDESVKSSIAAEPKKRGRPKGSTNKKGAVAEKIATVPEPPDISQSANQDCDESTESELSDLDLNDDDMLEDDEGLPDTQHEDVIEEPKASQPVRQTSQSRKETWKKRQSIVVIEDSEEDMSP